MSLPLVPDYAAAWAFLDCIHPGRLRVVTGIALDKKHLPTATFRPDQGAEFAQWVNACAKMPANLYFSVAEPMGPASKKMDRTDCARVWHLHVDIDPHDGKDLQAEQARILQLLRNPPGLPPPTGIIFSGAGYQALWALAEPIEIGGDLAKAEDAALYNRAIESAVGGDNCHDVSRILRLPGTINLPDARKTKKGRTPALAQVVEWHGDRVYPLSAFPKTEPAQVASAEHPGKVDASSVRRIAHMDDLGSAVSDRTKQLIANGFHPDAPKHFPSRSEAVFHVACELVRAGVDEPTILGVLQHPDFGIAESVREKGRGAARYAARQVENARADVQAEAAEFQTDKDGTPYATPHNIRVSIHRQGVRLWWDSFSDRKFVEGLDGFGPHLDDRAVVRLWINAQEHHKLRVGKEYFHDIVSDTALSNRRHPVREYLEGVADTWDGTPRVETWLIDYAGAEDSAYVRAVSRLPIVAAVRRILQPGAKFDECVILEGPQGGGKSSLLRTLCPDDAWFLDDLPLSDDAKRFIESLRGKWIVEAGELKGMRKAEVDALKSALSRQVDRARLAYGREPVELPRQCVIFGTTNSERYLKDTTGNRRFWPIRCGALNVSGLAQVRDQLWAEAVRLEADGVSIRLDPALYPHAAEAQNARRQEDPFMEDLEPALSGVVGKLRSRDAWAIVGKGEPGHRTQEDMNRLGECLRLLGWERTKRRFGGEPPEWCYVRGTTDSERAVRLQATPGADGRWRVRPEEEGQSYAF